MANVTQNIVHYLLTFIRHVINVVAAFVGLLHPTQRGKLPPVDDQISYLSARELSEKIRGGDIKCQTVIKCYIDRIKKVQPYLNAMIDDRFEAALEDAKQVDKWVELALSGDEAAKGFLKRPLLGVPFTCKDSISMKGMSYTAGSVLRKGVKGEEDASVIKNMYSSGAILLGVTNVPEVVMFWDTDNKLFGRTKNPYDLSRIAGGSSGGEAALLASAGSIVGVGSDAGGSIRIPAMCCGIFGHKTTPGIVPIDIMCPTPCNVWKPYVAYGPLCRYPSDIPLLLKAMAGDAAEELELDTPVDLNTITVYYMDQIEGNPLVTPVTDEIKRCIKKAVDHMHVKYHVKGQKVLFKKFALSLHLWSASFKVGDGFPLKAEMKMRNGQINPFLELLKAVFRLSHHTLGPIVASVSESLSFSPNSPECIKLISIANDLRDEFNNLLGSNGVFFYPTLPEPAVKHQTTTIKSFDVNYPCIMNVLGVPVTHCPAGFSSEGLPLGFQVAAAPFNDRLTIAVACELEKLFGGWTPP